MTAPVRVVHYADLETVLDEPGRAAALTGTVDALRDDRTVVVGAGDNTAPGALSLATEGAGAIPLFEALDPHADTFGNHDFDFGPERARELADAAPQPWLCANARVDDASETRFAAGATTPSTLVTLDGATVGVVGVAHPETAAMSYTTDGVRFTDPVPAVRARAAELRAEGADHVVVASHCGRGDERIARECDVAAVLGGHVHDVHVDRVADTAVVRPGRAGRHVSVLTLGETPTAEVRAVTDEAVDTALQSRLRAAHAEHGLDEVVAVAETPIERTERAATVAESRVGNFLTDALRWRAGADVAISPPGAIRSGEPLSGSVTVADLVGLAPYRDDLVTVALSGDRLQSALVAVPFGYHDDGHPDRHCCHVSGARIVWDDAAGTLREATVGGAAVDPDRSYTVAVADYLVETDHVIGAINHDDVVATHGPATEAIVDYARENGVTAALERRVRRPTLESE
jgi:2',3'-cyclic-nucleotide 2'-phosphodiesterase (5'-nucleotidase family)